MRVVIPVALLIIAGGAAWWLLQPEARRTTVPPARTTASAQAQPVSRAGAPTTMAPSAARPAASGSKLPGTVTNALNDTIRDRIRRDLVRKSAQGVIDKVAVQAPATKAGGVMSREAVKFAIDQSKPGIVDCYEQALEKTPDLAGRLTMKFTVHVKEGVGTLRDAEVVEDGLGNPFLGMCALGAVAKVEFEAEEDGVITVNYPFNLNPGPKAPKGE